MAHTDFTDGLQGVAPLFSAGGDTISVAAIFQLKE